MKNGRLSILLVLALAGHAGAGGGREQAPTSPCPGPLTLGVPALERRLEAAEALWRRRGPRAYRISGQSAALSSPTLRGWKVEVRPGRAPLGWTREVPAWMNPRPSLGTVPYQPAPPDLAVFFTVPALFGAVRSNLQTAREAGSCGVFTLRFDPRDGHLVLMRSFNTANVDNDSITEVKTLEPLP